MVARPWVLRLWLLDALGFRKALGGESCPFELLNNTRCDLGVPLKQLHTESSAECCMQCQALQGCHAFKWNLLQNPSSPAGQCELSDRPAGGRNTENGTVCGMERDVPPGPDCTVCMRVFANVSCVDPDDGAMKNALTNTSAECCTLCQQTDGCQAWTWDRNRPNVGLGREVIPASCRLSSSTPEGPEWRQENTSICGISRNSPYAGPTPPPTVAPTGVDGYIGCFVDLNNSADRDLPYFFCSNSTDPTPMSGASYCADDPRLPTAVVRPGEQSSERASPYAAASRMSVAVCRALCHRFSYFGIQAGSLCFCGNSYGHFGRASESECNVSCTGGGVAERCGGALRNSVYSNPPAPQPDSGIAPAIVPKTWIRYGTSFEPVTCIIDSAPPDNQPALPIFFCPLAIEHTPGECFDGTCCGSVDQVPSPECNGLQDPSNCNRNQASTTGMSGLTLELCDALCAGFPYFGIQGGTHCYCGESYTRYGNATESKCNVGCAGNTKQQCGGGFGYTSVYRRLEVRRSLTRPTTMPSLHPASTLLRKRRHRRNTRALFHRRARQEPANVTIGENLLKCYGPLCGVPKPAIDWTTAGMVVPPKDQGDCNASWVFAAVAAVESAHAIATGNLIPLSEQQVLDCATSTGAQSCEGGTVRQAFLYFASNDACSDTTYRYSGKNRRCCGGNDLCTRVVPSAEGGGLQGYCDVAINNGDALVSVLQHQPVAVGLAVGPKFFNYTGGILADCGGYGQLNHAALVVGYGAENGKPYWKLKNSMGTTWGEGGYVRISATGDDECMTLASASYPIVLSTDPKPPKPKKPHHYGAPPCLAGEVEMNFPGLNESICTHKCNATAPGSSQQQGCPKDAGPGTQVDIGCVLQDTKTGEAYCAPMCGTDCDCGLNGRCQNVEGILVCVPLR